MPAVSCHPFRHGKYRMNISGSRLLDVLEKWLPWIVAALITGCAHYPENVRLDEYNQEEGYRFANLNYEDNAGDWLVVATFSGGGTRAAALGRASGADGARGAPRVLSVMTGCPRR